MAIRALCLTLMTPTTIIQWNINGLNHKIGELEILLTELDPLIVCIQETHLTPSIPSAMPGYTDFRLDDTRINRAKGGVLTYVKSQVKSTRIPLNTNLQAVAVVIEAEIRFTVCNIYLPHPTWDDRDITIMY